MFYSKLRNSVDTGNKLIFVIKFKNIVIYQCIHLVCIFTYAISSAINLIERKYVDIIYGETYLISAFKEKQHTFCV